MPEPLSMLDICTLFLYFVSILIAVISLRVTYRQQRNANKPEIIPVNTNQNGVAATLTSKSLNIPGFDVINVGLGNATDITATFKINYEKLMLMWQKDRGNDNAFKFLNFYATDILKLNEVRKIRDKTKLSYLLRNETASIHLPQPIGNELLKFGNELIGFQERNNFENVDLEFPEVEINLLYHDFNHKKYNETYILTIEAGVYGVGELDIEYYVLNKKLSINDSDNI